MHDIAGSQSLFSTLIYTASFALSETLAVIFPLKSDKNRSCTILHVHVMKVKAFPKNTFLKIFTKLTFLSNFTVNELFPATISWSNT